MEKSHNHELIIWSTIWMVCILNLGVGIRIYKYNAYAQCTQKEQKLSCSLVNYNCYWPVFVWWSLSNTTYFGGKYRSAHCGVSSGGFGLNGAVGGSISWLHVLWTRAVQSVLDPYAFWTIDVCTFYILPIKYVRLFDCISVLTIFHQRMVLQCVQFWEILIQFSIRLHTGVFILVIFHVQSFYSINNMTTINKE